MSKGDRLAARYRKEKDSLQPVREVTKLTFSTSQPLQTFTAATFIVAAGWFAYFNSLHGVFILDDKGEIVVNDQIQSPTPLTKWLTDTRGLVRFTLALNHANNGLIPEGYHTVNVIIHLIAGLLVYGIVSRSLVALNWTLLNAFTIALLAALIFVLHPLQTQAVTYIVQRAESLMGMFYLLTIYCFVRATASPVQVKWLSLSVVACALGMLCKEVMVTAPIVVLLYDRCFVSGTFRNALKTRWKFYLALAATWGVIVLAGLWRTIIPGAHEGPVTVGFGTKGITAWQYALTQTGVILHYLRLFIWPHPLCLDYDWPIAKSLGEVLVPAFVLAALLLTTIYLLIKRPKIGFLCAFFFIILAPTSSIVPIKDPIFEHRMYLSVAALSILTILGIWRLLKQHPQRVLAFGIPLCAILAFATFLRNRDYQSEVRMWSDVVRQYPHNARAQSCLGVAFAMEGRLDEAITAYKAAVAADPDHVEAQGNLGKALNKQGRFAEAIEHFEHALAKDPEDAAFRHSYAVALGQLGRNTEEITQYQEVLKRQPANPMAHYNLAMALMRRGDKTGAIQHLQEVLKITPDDAEARQILARLTSSQGS